MLSLTSLLYVIAFAFKQLVNSAPILPTMSYVFRKPPLLDSPQRFYKGGTAPAEILLNFMAVTILIHT